MYVDLGFKLYIVAIPSIIHFAILGKEEYTEFVDFMI